MILNIEVFQQAIINFFNILHISSSFGIPLWKLLFEHWIVIIGNVQCFKSCSHTFTMVTNNRPFNSPLIDHICYYICIYTCSPDISYLGNISRIMRNCSWILYKTRDRKYHHICLHMIGALGFVLYANGYHKCFGKL